MQVIPAIDLRAGRCVRLYQGDYARETVVGDDPVAMARHWQAAGAHWLHVVDLDGARAGAPAQLDLVERICAALSIPVELGGGLRRAEDVAAALAAGVARVIVGTVALEDPALVSALLDRHGPERIVLGLDAREGRVASRGWLDTSSVEAGALARAMAARGVRTVVYTDIGRDGTLTGPNVAATAALAAASGLEVIASGGVSARADLAALAAAPGIVGVIVGKALYTGDVRLGVGERVETRNSEMRTTGREDERRRREEVLATSLQQQVDELRHLLREQATRQQRQDEQVRQMEAQLAQVRLDLGEARQETSRLAQLRQIEDQRVRQILTEVQQRVDEPVRPLRNLQAQLTDLTDQVRAHREQTAQEGRQIEAVAGRLDAVRGDALRALEMHRQTREIFDSLQQTQANHARDIQKVSDQAKVIEQETRRRAAGVEQRLENLSLRIDEVGSYRPQLEESLRAVREDIRAFQPQIDAQTQRLKQHEAHLARVQAQAEERDTIMRERTEDVRTALASEIGGVTTALNEAIAAVYARLGEWEEAQREVGGRVSEVAVEAAGLREMQARLGEALLRSEERLVRLNLELAQGAWEALMARRQRESEG